VEVARVSQCSQNSEGRGICGIPARGTKNYTEKPQQSTNPEYIPVGTVFPSSVRLHPHWLPDIHGNCQAVKTLPKNLASTSSTIPRSTGSPPNWVVRRKASKDVVARIGPVPPGQIEQFAFRLIVLHRPLSSFSEAKLWNGEEYPSYRSAAVAMGLYVDGKWTQRSVRRSCTDVCNTGRTSIHANHTVSPRRGCSRNYSKTWSSSHFWRSSGFCWGKGISHDDEKNIDFESTWKKVA